MTKVIMIQGTQSNVGKSLLVAGICRAWHNRGIDVAPFKPQNMALNSAVTADGGEIGRAQALQAQACRLEPTTLMNPVLIKPNSDQGAQIVVGGKVLGNMSARQYHDYKPTVKHAVLEHFQRLASRHQCIVVEGAGSPAEINLRDHDIANMGFAEAVNCPVVLAGNIDPGGVFAQLLGTLAVINDREQARIKGFIINQFRGDIRLLEPGLQWLEQRSGKPVLGVVPFLNDLQLDAEDSMNLSAHPSWRQDTLRVGVVRLPRLSNHTDFEPLVLHGGVSLRYLQHPTEGVDLLILPGTKNVIADLLWMCSQGWPEYIQRHLRYGGKLLGICGGFQMLGHTLSDPLGMESDAGTVPGLGLLDMHTTLSAEKILQKTSGRWITSGAVFHGYEIHLGQTEGKALQSPAMNTPQGDHGAMSDDNAIAGGYIHGLLDQQSSLQAVLQWAGLKSDQTPDFDSLREQAIERVAGVLEQSIDMDRLWAIAN